MSRILLLPVSKIVQESPDAISIHFPQPKVHKIWYKAGQYLTLAVEINGQKHYRPYSISTALRLDDTMAVTVKRLPGGLVSNYLHDHIKIGDQLEVIQPTGKFFIESSVKFHRHIWLFGAGSGITPLMSILRSVLFNEPKCAVSLVYGNRNETDIIFRDRLDELREMFPDRFQLLHYLSGESQGTLEHYRKGRLSQHDIPTILEDLWLEDFQENRFFLCGPEGFMDAVGAGLKEAGIPEEHIAREFFFLEEEIRPEIAKELKTREVEVSFAGENFRFNVPAGARILETALQREIPLPYSCRRGICSTCVGRLRKGKVRMAHNEALTEWEVENGYVLTCQSFPLSEDVEIAI